MNTPNNQDKRIKKAGFSMIELLSALAIFGILVLALYIVFDRANQVWKQGGNKSDLYQNARTALDMMSREISSAIISTGGSSSFDATVTPHLARPYLWGVNATSSGYDRDQLFFTLSRNNALYEVGYFVDNQGLRRAYTSIDPPATKYDFDITSTSQFGTVDTLAFNITDLNFLYIYKSGATYVTIDEWDSRMAYQTGLSNNPTTPTIDDGKLPDYIEISIKILDRDNNQRKEYKTLIPMNQRSFRNE